MSTRTPKQPRTHRAAAVALAATTALALSTAGPWAAAQGGAAAAPTQAVADEPPPGFDAAYLGDAANIEAGRAVWVTQCRHCHGNAAYPGKAPKLKPGLLEPDFIFDRVTYGFRGMPGWREVFSREQRKAVVAYIKSESFSP